MLDAERVLEITNDILVTSDYKKLDKIKSLCEESIRDDTAIRAAKQSGGNQEVKRYKAALNILTDDRYTGAWCIDDKQYFTNTFIGFELTNHIKNLPNTANELSNMVNLFHYNSGTYEEVELPSFAELQSKVKLAKAELRAINKPLKPKNHKKLSDIPQGLYIHENELRKWGCNIEYLLMAVEVLGGKQVLKLPTSTGCRVGFIESENGSAIISPIRLDKGE
jgi:hypothetical protein